MLIQEDKYFEAVNNIGRILAASYALSLADLEALDRETLKQICRGIEDHARRVYMALVPRKDWGKVTGTGTAYNKGKLVTPADLLRERVNFWKEVLKKTIPEEEPGQVFTIPGYAAEYVPLEEEPEVEKKKPSKTPKDRYDEWIKKNSGKGADNG